jgi:hypothetical protein
MNVAMLLNLITANVLAMEMYYVPVNPNQIAVGPDEFQREFVKKKCFTRSQVP